MVFNARRNNILNIGNCAIWYSMHEETTYSMINILNIGNCAIWYSMHEETTSLMHCSVH
jgi:hypothetical protein